MRHPIEELRGFLSPNARAPAAAFETEEAWDPVSPLGDPYRVNANTAGEQVDVSTIALPAGRLLVTWTSLVNGERSIAARAIDSDGSPAGGDLEAPSGFYTALPDGTIAVTWAASEVIDGELQHSVWLQRFDQNLDPVAAAARVADTAGEDVDRIGVLPAVALADGDCLIVWAESVNVPFGSLQTQVYFRRYDVEDDTLGASVAVGAQNEFDGLPVVTELTSGALLLTWVDDSFDDGSVGYAQLFDVSGNALGEKVVVTTYPLTGVNHNTIADAVALSDGGFAILWYADAVPVAEGLRISRYDATGALLDSFDTPSPSDSGRLVALEEGGFVVVWDDRARLLAQALTEGGAVAGDAFVVTDQLDAFSGAISYDIDARADGSYVVTWNGRNQGGSDIFAREFRFEIGTIALDDAAHTLEDQPVTIAVLANDADATDDLLTIIAANNPANGSVTINADGTITYTPDAEFFGVDSFDYTISDGAGGADTATVRVTIEYVDDNDTFNGGAGGDALDGGGGDDRVNGFDGDDTLDGGDGADRAYGGDGNDFASGGDGEDTLVGNEGDDELSGDRGVDRLRGDEGADLLRGRSDDDELIGGIGDDRLIADSGTDMLSGEAGDDRLEGGLDKDIIEGGGGDDLIIGGEQRDTMTGGAGADRFRFDALEDFSGEAQFADRIVDFSQAQGDRIDLRKLDAVAGGLDSDFVFVGGGAFSGVAGELRFEQISGALTYVEGDIDGDGAADFTIRLETLVTLTEADFLL